MKPGDKEQLQRILSALDETGLVALSNKGLVRRAQKDLESGGLLVEEAEQSLIVRGADWTVWMPPAGPAHARDDTKASGITRQILTATMYLRDVWFNATGQISEAVAAGTQPPPSSCTTRQRVVAEASSVETPPASAQITSIVSPCAEAPPNEEPPPQGDFQPLCNTGRNRPSEAESRVDVAIDLAKSANSESDSCSTPASSKSGSRGTPTQTESTMQRAITPKQTTAGKSTVIPEGEALRDALIALTPPELTKWCGKTLFREMSALLQQPVHLEIECAVGLTMRFPDHKIEVRLLPTTEKGVRLLEQLLTTGPKALHKRWALLAILELHRNYGKDISPQTDTTVDPSMVRNQQQILHSTQQLLEGMLSMGVSHPSNRVIERLFTLSVSASAMQLPRLSHMLRALSQEVSRLLTKEVSGDTRRLFEAMSQCYALAKALQAVAPERYRELAGATRTQYDPAGDLTLSGVGAYPWQTDSGYEGITVVFWEAIGQRFLTWSASRRTSNAGRFDLDQIYRSQTAWAQCGAIEKLCRSRFVLRNAKINYVGRLSAGQQSLAGEDVPGPHPEQIDFGHRLFKNWTSLRQYVNEQTPIGLRLHNPLDRIVVLEPTCWGERFFDEMQQAFCWQIHDENMQPLALTLQWNGMNEGSTEFLEALRPDRDRLRRILVRFNASSAGTLIEPISFFSSGTPHEHFVLNPAFDRALIESRQSTLLEQLRKKYGKDRIPTAMTSDDDWEELLQPDCKFQPAPAAIRILLSEIDTLLLRLAESGSRQIQEKTRQQIQTMANNLSRSGLLELGKHFSKLAEETGSIAGPLLWTDYLCRLHWQALAVNSAE